MSLLRTEPFVTITSLAELFAVAAAMESEAIDGYTDLARRMRDMNRPELADVFEQLVAEETMHLNSVGHFSERLTGKAPDVSALRGEPEHLFDDEGTSTIAPELVSAYRAFSIAVRNEERAFAFWTYVASQGVSDELRRAAEQMAREELDHVARLRRERRQAFHKERACGLTGDNWSLADMEGRLSMLLDEAAYELSDGDLAGDLEAQAEAARLRAETLESGETGETALLKNVSPEVSTRLGPAVELLLDSYLDLGERLPSQEERGQVQIFAAEMLDCLSAVRRLSAS